MKVSNFKFLDKYMASWDKMDKEQLKKEIWKWLKIALQNDVIVKINNDARIQNKYKDVGREDLVRIIDSKNKDIGILKDMLSEYTSIFEAIKDLKTNLSEFVKNNNPNKRKKKAKYVSGFTIDDCDKKGE